jgi:hypothetical protein
MVMALVSLLMGLSIGFLQRGSTDFDLALGIVRDQMRLAANTARSRGLPTEVHILPAQDNEPVRLEARILRSVGFWHLEPGERWINAGLRPQLTGSPEPQGRFGQAWRPDLAARASMLTITTGDNDAFYLDQGFALRLDLKLEARAPMVVARLGRAFELSLTDDLIPEARVTLTDPGPRPGPVARVRGRRPLRTGRWLTLELVHDGRTLAVLVDGREAGRAPAAGAPFQQSPDLFEVSLGSVPVRGLVDEIQLLAYERGELMALPFEAELRDLKTPVRFTARGELREPARFTLVLRDESVGRLIAPGGVLRSWTKVAKTGE